MIFGVEQKDTQSIFKTSIVQQTAFWSEVKQQQGVHSLAFNFKVHQQIVSNDCVSSPESNYIETDILVLLQHIDAKYTIAYIPYGPEIEPDEENQGKFLEELSESLRAYLPPTCIL